MKRSFLIALAAVGFASATSAQNSQYVYFSTFFAETPASGRGGNIGGLTPPTHPLIMGFGYVNEAAVLNHQGVAVVRPGVPNMIPIFTLGCPTPPNCPPPPPAVVDFVEIANIPQFNLEAGDTNNDGLYNGGTPNFASMDAVWVPFPPPNRAANLHEMFFSVSGDSAGALGYRGTAITEADVMLLPAAPNLYPLPSTPQAPIFFIRQSHLEVFFGMAPGTGGTIDTDGFCVDQSNGDIYMSFDGPSGGTSALALTGTFLSAPATLTTTAVHAGDIFRIPGNAYTPSGPYGIVTNPQPNLIQRVYTQADVTTMVITAGGCITNTGTTTGALFTNSRGLSIDFTAALPTTATPQGFVIKQLFFTVNNRGTTSAGCPGTPSTCQPGFNQNLTAAAIYSTQTGGSFAVINGTIMNQPSALGIHDCSFSSAFFTGPLDAACVVQLATPYDPVAGGPFHLDNFPDSNYNVTMPPPPPPMPSLSAVTGYIAGATPGGTVAILGRADIPVAGSYIDRYSTLAFGILGGYPDLFIDLIGINNSSFLIAPYLLTPYGQNAAAQSFFNGGPAFPDWNPILTYTDYNVTPPANNGDSAFSMDLTPLIGQVPFPFILTFQAVDLASSPLRLSDAISFEFVYP